MNSNHSSSYVHTHESKTINGQTIYSKDQTIYNGGSNQQYHPVIKGPNGIYQPPTSVIVGPNGIYQPQHQPVIVGPNGIYQPQNQPIITGPNGIYQQQYQQFGNKTYYLASGLGHDLVLDASQDKKDFNNLIVWQNNHGANQKFVIIHEGNGSYRIRGSQNQLNVQASNPSSGARVVLSQKNGTPSELWALEPVSVGNTTSFYLKNRGSGKYLDVFQSNSHKGTKVIQWQFTGGQNQVWTIKQAF